MIARASSASLVKLGILDSRAASLRHLAIEIAGGALALDGVTVDPDRVIAQLLAIPGIGEWTAQYLAMRVLRFPDAFPATDLGVRRALAGAFLLCGWLFGK